MKLKEFLKRITFYKGSKFERFVWQKKYERNERIRRKKKNKVLNQFGIELLDKLTLATSDMRVNFWLEWGTLLGGGIVISLLFHMIMT